MPALLPSEIPGTSLGAHDDSGLGLTAQVRQSYLRRESFHLILVLDPQWEFFVRTRTITLEDVCLINKQLVHR